MKRFIALFLAMIMVLSFAACGEAASASEETAAEETDVLASYPSDIHEWTAEDFNSYFKAIGLYENDDYIFVQDHESYWFGTVVDEGAGYMDDTGDYMTEIFVVDEDSTEGDAQAFLDGIREAKAFPEELGSIPLDHMCGNILFFYGFSQDEEFYNSMESAVTDLCAKLGAELDF